MRQHITVNKAVKPEFKTEQTPYNMRLIKIICCGYPSLDKIYFSLINPITNWRRLLNETDSIRLQWQYVQKMPNV